MSRATSPIFALMLITSACAQSDQIDEKQAVTPACSGIAKQEMVWIPASRFTLGEDPRYPEEGPPREVDIDGFWISRTEVTNAQFATFVKETEYLTEAERDPPALLGAPPEMQMAGSAAFRVPTQDNPNWWKWVPGAQWRNPSGPESDTKGRGNDPVVHVTFNDALAYAEWAGMSLPSEEQWEYAARAGEPALLEPKSADGQYTANYYQGVFPAKDLGEDGYTSRSPVGCFQANAFGLHDMIGNVWEWTINEARPGRPENIIKGGSFLCASNYCARYRPAARQYQERDLGTDHIGFRVVDNSREPPAATLPK